jgi:hypothetical protein
MNEQTPTPAEAGAAPRRAWSARVLRAIEPLVFAHRRLTMAVLLLITVALGWQTLLIRRDAGFDKSIPLEHSYMQVLKQYQADFGGANTVLVALVRRDGDIYDARFLARLKAATDDVFFLNGIDRPRVSSLFTPDVRFLEVVEGGFQGGNVIPADFQPTPEMLERVRTNVAKGGHVGRYTTRDQHGAMIFAELLETDPATGRKLDYAQVAAALEQLRAEYEDADVEVHILGFAKVVGDVIDATEQVVLFFLVTMVMTLLLLWVYLGSFRLALLPLLCSATAVVWEFGLLRLAGFGLDPFAILVPFLILAVSVSHGVQYVNAWLTEITCHQRSAYDASLLTWRRLAVYGTFAILTDVAGFATIYLIPIDIIREMALNAVLGMAAIIVTNKVMMPIWLCAVRIGDTRRLVARQQRRDAALDGLWRWLSNLARPLPATLAIVVTAALFGWSLWQGRALQIGDSHAGVPELLPDSRYNRDTAAVVGRFAIGTDVLKIVAETDAQSCIEFGVMDQIDRFAWHMQNTPGVQSTQSLPQVAKQVNAAYSEGNPKFELLPRNQQMMVQAITPVPTTSGLLNPDCSAMAVLVFLRDHKAATLRGAVDAVRRFDADNRRAWLAAQAPGRGAYCDAKNQARRELGIARTDLHRRREQLRAREPGLAEDELARRPAIARAAQAVEAAGRKLGSFGDACPVHFALATGNVGVMAATNEEVHRLEQRVLLYVYVAIVICIVLSFFDLASLVSILVPLVVVSFMAYAVMALAGIGMKVATLPVVSLAVGVGVDYGIYLYATLADSVARGLGMRAALQRTYRMTGQAVVFTGLTLGLGVATWLASGLQFQRDMGLLLVFTFIANLFGAILVLPAIASFLLRRRERAARATNPAAAEDRP